MPTQTAVVPYDNDLVRQKWLMEGLIQSRTKSFWSEWTGTSKDNIVYQVNDFNQKEGHTVVFDFDGFLSGEGFAGKERAFGKGETKKKFSDKLEVVRGRYSVDNGDIFDGVNIGDLSITQHSDSREKLSNLWTRAKEQILNDTAQGYLNGSAPTHILRPSDRTSIANLTSSDLLSYDYLLQIEDSVKTGEGFTSGSTRMPLVPVDYDDEDPLYLFMIDTTMARQLKQDDDFRTIMAQADVRGNKNRLIKGYLGRVGSLVIVERMNFHGVSSSNRIFKTGVEMPGLRTVDEAGVFSGTKVSQSGVIASRGLILGKGALMFGNGKAPDYKWRESEDFGITSESALEVWCNSKKTKLIPATDDYEVEKVNGVDFGIVAVEVYNKAI